jgi:hypothetical protein
MLPGAYAMTIYRGDTSAWTFVLWADFDKTDPVDLTGYTVKSEIRNAPGGSTIVPLDLVVTAPNIIEASLSTAASRLLPASGRWDLQLTDATGVVMTVLAGPVKVVGDITDSTSSSLSARSDEQPVPAGHLRRLVG